MKYKRIALAFLLFTLPLAGLFVDVPQASALTKDEQLQCYEQWNTKTFSTGSDTHNKWNESKCNTPSMCAAAAGSSAGYKIACIHPDDPKNPCNPLTYDKRECEKARGVTDCNDLGDCTEKTSFEFCGRNEDVGIQCMFNEVLAFFSILVGILVVGGVVIGGIMYSTSQGNPSQTQRGITIIANSVIGLVLYLLLYAIINWLLPGGVIRP